MTLLGAAAAVRPLAMRAQQALPVSGFLHEGLPAHSSLTAAFQQGLIETDWCQARCSHLRGTMRLSHSWAASPQGSERVSVP